MATASLEEIGDRDFRGPVFFASAFRPFFLFAAIQAAVMLPLWLAIWLGAVDLDLPYDVMLWHGHEMVFGFASAAVGGFLLTAVPDWVGARLISGRPLIAVFALWLVGRVAFTLGGLLPPLVVAAADLAYLPVLAVLLASPLFKAGNWRNAGFLLMLAVFWLCDLAVHLGLAGIGDPLAGVHGGILALMLMVVVVSGRILPFFTKTWTTKAGRPAEPGSIAWIEKGGAAASLVIAGGTWMTAPESTPAGVLLLAAAAIHAVRLAGWRGERTLVNPLLWVLHLGYLWLVAGLALLGLSVFIAELPSATALHGLTVGCMGTMVIGVASRGVLCHAGRPLVAERPVVAAYVLVSASAVLRLAAPMFSGQMVPIMLAGGLAWCLAWLLFVVVYLPVVISPRADGQPG